MAKKLKFKSKIQQKKNKKNLTSAPVSMGNSDEFGKITVINIAEKSQYVNNIDLDPSPTTVSALVALLLLSSSNSHGGAY